jgi:predicted amidophosphoribosyltransferase
MRFFQELNSLLFPTRCFGCRALGYSICSQCRILWNPHIYKSDFAKLSVYSAITYSPVAKNILLAAKEQSVKSADELVKIALRISVESAFRKFSSCALVPIPSALSSNRRRGRDFIYETSLVVGKDLGVAVLPLLQHQRAVRDQSKLDINSRRENLSMALIVKPAFRGNYLAEKVVILDDLLTTGATINEANRALTSAGYQVQAAATACVAVLRRE